MDKEKMWICHLSMKGGRVAEMSQWSDNSSSVFYTHISCPIRLFALIAFTLVGLSLLLCCFFQPAYCTDGWWHTNQHSEWADFSLQIIPNFKTLWIIGLFTWNSKVGSVRRSVYHRRIKRVCTTLCLGMVFTGWIFRING